MHVTSLWTLRCLTHQVFRQIVEEWEDDFSAALSLPLRDISACETRANGRFGALLRRLPAALAVWDDAGRRRRAQSPTHGALAFVIWPPASARSYWVQPDVVPVVIDCWREHLAAAPVVFARSPLVFVTNREIERALAATSLGARVRYLPVSVSARHVCAVVPEKSIDLVQVGRRNPRLHEWALEYVRAHPESEYLYADTSGTWPRWTSTRRGVLALDTSRASYLALLRSARVSLVSAPGIDGGEVRTSGFNPVTPRFYESAAARCHLIGRFPHDGADFTDNRVSTACRHVDSFDGFAAAVDHARTAPPDLAGLDTFLAGHITSEVAQSAGEILKSVGLSIGEN